jgi:hypothetical protein
MTVAIRYPFMVRGAGERPAQSSLPSPVCVLPDCSPLWRAFVHLAYKYSKKVHAVSRYAGDCPRARAELCLRFNWLGSSRACVPCGDRTIVLRLHRRFGCSGCQPFFLDAMDRTPKDLISRILLPVRGLFVLLPDPAWIKIVLIEY